MTTKELETRRNVLMQELAAYVPAWDDDETVLMRMVAARLMKQSGVSLEVAKAVGAQLNSLIKQAITLGYALHEYDRRNGIVRGQQEPSGFFMTTKVLEAA